MRANPVPTQPSSAGLPGILRLIAGLAVLALAVVAGMGVLDLLPREQLAGYGTKILLLGLIVALASSAIAGLVRWGQRDGTRSDTDLHA
jgi:hypothetical protein